MVQTSSRERFLHACTSKREEFRNGLELLVLLVRLIRIEYGLRSERNHLIDADVVGFSYHRPYFSTGRYIDESAVHQLASMAVGTGSNS